MNGLLVQSTAPIAAGLSGSAQSAATSAAGKNNGMFNALLLAAVHGEGTGNGENSLLAALAAFIQGLQTAELPDGQNVNQDTFGQETEKNAFLTLLAALLGGQELSVKQWPQLVGNGQGAKNLADYQGIFQLANDIHTEQLEQVLDRLLLSGKGSSANSAISELEQLAGRIVQLLTPASQAADKVTFGKMKAEELAALKLLALLGQAESAKVSLPAATKEKLEQAATLLVRQHPLLEKALAGVQIPGRLRQQAERAAVFMPAVIPGIKIAAGEQIPDYLEGSVTVGTAAGETQKAAHFQYYPQLAHLMDVAGFRQSSESNVFSVPLPQEQSTATSTVRAVEFARHMATFMTERINWLNGNGTSQATIRLYPENLGQVDVKIVTQNGQVTAHFVTETVLGRDLLESQMASLRAALMQQGLQVDRLQVSYNPSTPFGGMAGESMFHQQQHNFKEQQEFAKRNHLSVYGSGELEEETFLIPEVYGQATGIDYMA